MHSFPGRVLCLDLGQWNVRVECDLPNVLHRLSTLFENRAGTTPRGRGIQLHCEVFNQAPAFETLAREVRFDGPEIKVSEGVFLRYGRDHGRILIRVSRTAILEINPLRPAFSRVYLDSESYGPQNDVACPSAGPKPEPEAFFYPLLVEWLRHFDACLMHCGAVAVAGRAIVLTGPPGSGKSTHVLRLVNRGCDFLADDLAILHRSNSGLQMLPFREVLNVSCRTLELFPELDRIRTCPRRGDNKYQVDLRTHFSKSAVATADPGALVRLFPDPAEWIRPGSREDCMAALPDMAWFVTDTEASQKHFWLLADWIAASSVWEVSQGYLAKNLDRFLETLHPKKIA